METIYKSTTTDDTWHQSYPNDWFNVINHTIIKDIEMKYMFQKGEVYKTFTHEIEDKEPQTHIDYIYNLCTYDDLDADEKIERIKEYIKDIIVITIRKLAFVATTNDY